VDEPRQNLIDREAKGERFVRQGALRPQIRKKVGGKTAKTTTRPRSNIKNTHEAKIPRPEEVDREV